MRVVEPLETLLTALMLAFVFRAFFIEAFIIPTGSMAPGLCGRHATLLCPACGTIFDFGLPEDADSTRGGRFAPAARCPNCREPVEIRPGDERAGDRILVHKWLAWLWPGAGLRRWDPIVFRDPADPRQHYIKRLVGLPGETVEIVDGDIFIGSKGGEPHIARKPPAAQEATWIPVFDQSRVPFDGGANAAASVWALDPPDPPPDDSHGFAGWTGLDERELRFVPAQEHRFGLRFDPQSSMDFQQDFYAYNGGASGAFFADVRLKAAVRMASSKSRLEIHLTRDANEFVATIGGDGVVELRQMNPEAGSDTAISLRRVRKPPSARPLHVELAHCDWRVWLRIEGELVAQTSDFLLHPDLARLRERRRTSPAGIRLVAWGGALSLGGVQVDRDVYYTLTAGTVRARPSEPFELPDGCYFVLGDNSPRSHDAREWVAVAPELRVSQPYPAGTVRVDQIVGRAFFVYLPGWMSWDSAGRWRLPDIGRVRFIR